MPLLYTYRQCYRTCRPFFFFLSWWMSMIISFIFSIVSGCHFAHGCLSYCTDRPFLSLFFISHSQEKVPRYLEAFNSKKTKIKALDRASPVGFTEYSNIPNFKRMKKETKEWPPKRTQIILKSCLCYLYPQGIGGGWTWCPRKSSKHQATPPFHLANNPKKFVLSPILY